jgi:hypothetical protein
MSEIVVLKASDIDPTRIPPRPKRGNDPVRYVDQSVKVRGEPLDEIWWSGRQWAVTAFGIEALDGTYVIEKDRLLEKLSVLSWAEHVGNKLWVDDDDFVTARLVAHVQVPWLVIAAARGQ